MSGTVSLTGLGVGSGIDTESLVTALVGIEQQGENAMKDKLSATNASIQHLSSVSSLLSKLKAASDALTTTAQVGSYSATSTSSSLVASASGLASPGSYTVTIDKLAQEQRTYSNAITSATDPLGQAGTLTLGVGTGATTDISIAATDTIDDVISKINSSGQRVQASAFYDGSNYRVQLRGMDTGAANALSITETGTTFGFNTAGNTKQAAQDAQIQIDGYTVKSATNQITGAIHGVTLALTSNTTDSITVAVGQDTNALTTKLNTLVSAYNSVVSTVKALAGTASTQPQDALLGGDSMLRSIQSRLSSAIGTVIGSGSYNTLGTIGLSLDKDGVMSLDSAKLSAALTADPTTVSKILAGTDDGVTQGAMDVLSSAADLFSATGTGLIASRVDGLNTQNKTLQDRIDAEDARINRYADQLRTQFTAMDTQVAQWNSSAQYLISQLGQ